MSSLIQTAVCKVCKLNFCRRVHIVKVHLLNNEPARSIHTKLNWSFTEHVFLVALYCFPLFEKLKWTRSHVIFQCLATEYPTASLYTIELHLILINFKFKCRISSNTFWHSYKSLSTTAFLKKNLGHLLIHLQKVVPMWLNNYIVQFL